eukprot:1156557-Pelagomonas_calceolata.AAC.6
MGGAFEKQAVEDLALPNKAVMATDTLKEKVSALEEQAEEALVLLNKAVWAIYTIQEPGGIHLGSRLG